MGFSHGRNRPPPRLRVFPWLPAWALGGRGSAASRRTPFLDCPGKTWTGQPRRELEWPQAGRRQGSGSGRSCGQRIGSVSGEGGLSRRREGGGSGGGETVVGRERRGVGGVGWGSSGSCTRLWVWVVIALLSSAAGRGVCAAARARAPRRSPSGASEGPALLTGGRTPAPAPRLLAVCAERGGPFRDLRASLKAYD
jgi:hypothetical protein